MRCCFYFFLLTTAPVDGYLSKPINAVLLVQELTRLLKKTDGCEA